MSEPDIPLDVDPDSFDRRAPTLSGAPLLALQHSPHTGYGVFAAQDIPPGTQLLAAPGPAVYVIYRAFRKEACAWCFRYERGRNWKTRFDAAGAGAGDSTNSNGGGMVFCCAACCTAWLAEYGEVGRAAYEAVEALVQRQARSRGWNCSVDADADADDDDDDERPPTEQEIDEAWNSIKHQASLILSLRLSVPSPSPASKPPKAQAAALAAALRLPIRSPDTLLFLLSAVLARASPQWPALLSLSPASLASAPVYASRAALRHTTAAYLHLLAVLPARVLRACRPSRASLEAVLARDVRNSFGIWSVDTEAPAPPLATLFSDPKDCAEMLGFGIWPAASFFNHACAPPVTKRRAGRRWLFAAARAVPAHAECCISYISSEEALGVRGRRERLSANWGFKCACARCVGEDEEMEMEMEMGEGKGVRMEMETQEA